MADATTTAAPRPSLLRRIAARWRVARVAALIRSVPPAELGEAQPHPALVAPRAHAAVEAIAHPAVLELGLPAWLALVGYWLFAFDLHGLRPPSGQDLIGLLVIQLIVVFAATSVGMWIFARRYRRMARAAYHERQWRADEAGDVREAGSDA